MTPDQDEIYARAAADVLRTTTHLNTLLGDPHFRQHLQQLHHDIGTLLRLLDGLEDDARPSVYWHTDSEVEAP